MAAVDNGERFYHTPKQADAVAEKYTDEEWIAKVRHSGGMYAVNIYERDTDELVAKNV